MERTVEASLQFAGMSRGSAAQLIEVGRIVAQHAAHGEDFAWGGRRDAPPKLWMTDPAPARPEFGQDQPVAASTMAAELGVSRDCDPG